MIEGKIQITSLFATHPYSIISKYVYQFGQLTDSKNLLL